ncbi:hypothetical protein D0865_15356 [Hortaea werneckii]|uniref:Mitochondrial intermembrane space import and assembly protein 40 n=1 Tax=Hortaea werneckii TaxID=91943 RepID=A0A3M7ARC9_HORWE|nr:hypothetical protein D0865_15356 [Hortaea werneckii]
MYRPAVRAASSAASKALPRHAATTGRRFVSTAPPHQKSRSWKSSAVRWGLAGTLVYYYNTNNVFAEEPYMIHAPPETSRESETYPTIEAVAEQRRQQGLAQQSTQSTAAPDAGAPESPEALEGEASQQGAFNEETGEINWDCPCLGGMAHGPCGEQFKAAFSCFVYSKEEPKGLDCIDHFKTMQNCFKEHPDVYGSELDPDAELPEGEEVPGEQPAPAASPEPSAVPSPSQAATSTPHSGGEKVADSEASAAEKRERAIAAAAQVKENHSELSESEEVVPKAWHDSR